MEQKQLDEIDDSYFGEEFVDDEMFDDIVIETADGKSKLEKKSLKKKMDVHSTIKADSKQGMKEEGYITVGMDKVAMEKSVERGFSELKAKKDSSKIKTKSAAVSPKVEAKTDKADLNMDTPKIDVKEKLGRSEAKSEVKSMVKEEKNEVKQEKIVETVPSVNPWASEEKKGNETIFLKEVSTWKAITGLVVVLLLFSVFTQGFRFSNGEITSATVLSLNEAENAALSYVNNNLLQQPFVATLESSAEAGDVYKVTLSVAGQSVDSYITKDGKLFFPQAFDTSKKLAEVGLNSGVDSNVAPPSVVAVPAEENKGVQEEIVEETVAIEEEQPAEAAAPSAEVKPTGARREFKVAAKKWLFSPQKLVVRQGDMVVITIEPQDLEFTFAVPNFGIEQQVAGTTKVTFMADKIGVHQFSCASCEEWRGMTGTLVVE